MRTSAEEAVTTLTEAIQQNIRKAYCTRGKAHFSLRDWDSAISDLRECIDDDPRHPTAHLTMAAALSESREVRTHTAVRIFRFLESNHKTASRCFGRVQHCA